MSRSQNEREQDGTRHDHPAAPRDSTLVRVRREPDDADGAPAARDASAVLRRREPGQDGIPEEASGAARDASALRPRPEPGLDADNECDSASSTSRARPELDRSWLVAFKAGNRDPAFYRAFVTTYQKRVIGILTRMTGTGPHVEDLVQETMRRAVLMLPEFELDGRAKLSTWVIRLAIWEAKSWRRRPENKVRLVPIEESESLPDRSTPEGSASRREAERALRAALLKLPIDQELVIILRDYEGLSPHEIGEILKFHPERVKRTLRAARESLGEMLQSRKDQ